MIRVLVSACLLGSNVKYNGTSNYIESLLKDLEEFEIIPICPECAGGLSTPRIPSERIVDKVINKEGIDVTYNFIKGANIALKVALDHDIKYAILKSNSPSCGDGKIYDGTFSNTLIDGSGVTAEILKKNGIKVFNEFNYKEILKER